MTLERVLVDKEFKPVIHLEGRDVRWFMTPEITGGNYSSVCTVEVEPGKKCLPAHAHPYGEETVYIVEGTGKVLIGDEVGEIGPGSIMLFPQGVPHMLFNTGTGVLKGICFYAPAPEAISYEYFTDIDFP